MAFLTTVIPVFNGERFLRETLQSVVSQTRPPDRVVVVDNCSTDGTRKIFDEFAAHGFEWRQNETNIGLFGNLNRALEYAGETECLHLLLADDLVKPRFYERVLPSLDAVEGCGVAYCPYETIDGEGRLVKAAPLPSGSSPRTVPLKAFLAGQSELNTILVPAVILKTSHQPPAARFRPDVPQVGDCLFYAEWGRACSRIIEIPECLCQYRRHEASTTNRLMPDLKSWVLDEWHVMQKVSAMIDEPAPFRWLRQQKLRSLFAARSWIKCTMVRDCQPAYAAEIARVTRQITGAMHWYLGRSAVALRNRVRGKS